MFVVFTEYHVPCFRTWDEVEAATVSAQIGGYYVESGVY